MVADFSRTNAEKLVEGADVIVDGLDNFETRFLINDVALKSGIPWVYGGAIGSTGMTATFLPGEPPCFRCLVARRRWAASLTCDTAGVVNAAPWIIGSLEAAEALKILVGTAPGQPRPLVFDLWERSFESVPLAGFASSRLPGLRGTYEFLAGQARHSGHQPLRPERRADLERGAAGMPLAEIRERLSALGPVEGSEQMIRFPVGEQELVVFYDGRAIVRGTRDETLAKALYAKYVGM